MNPQEILVWSAPEYTHRSRGVDWFWGLGVFIVVGAIASVYFDDALFAIVLILAGITLALFAVRHPEEVEYALSPKGVRSGDTFYPFSSLESFWVTEKGHEEKIILISKKLLMMHIVIPVEGHSADEVKAFLGQYLPAVEHHEPFIYVLAERLGF